MLQALLLFYSNVEIHLRDKLHALLTFADGRAVWNAPYPFWAPEGLSVAWARSVLGNGDRLGRPQGAVSLRNFFQGAVSLRNFFPDACYAMSSYVTSCYVMP